MVSNCFMLEASSCDCLEGFPYKVLTTNIPCILKLPPDIKSRHILLLAIGCWIMFFGLFFFLGH